MLVLYSNTIAQLLGILPSHRQCDCLCYHYTCFCHRRKGITESYTAKKDHLGGHGPSPLKQKSRSKRLRESPTMKKTHEENLIVQTTGPQVVDSECNSTTFDKSNKPRKEKESKSEEESDNPLRDSEPSEHARLNKVEEEELRPESGNSPYRIESWLTQLPQNNKQNPWLVTLQDFPDGQGPGQTASRSKQPIRTHSMEEIKKQRYSCNRLTTR